MFRLQDMYYLYIVYYYSTLFILCMVGYNKLEVRRNVALLIRIFKLLKGKMKTRIYRGA